MGKVLIVGPTNAVSRILATDLKGVNLVILEAEDDGVAIPAAGPFRVDIADFDPPILTVTPGSPDNSRPTNVKPNGSMLAGDVKITVTDTSDPDLVGTVILTVALPSGTQPPPPTNENTQLATFLVPA
jgi:hypothetical protein